MSHFQRIKINSPCVYFVRVFINFSGENLEYGW